MRSKVIINDKTVERIKIFRYRALEVSYFNEIDKIYKTNKFRKVAGLINKILAANKEEYRTKIKVYHVITMPMLIYGSEVRAIKKTNKQSREAAERKRQNSNTKV